MSSESTHPVHVHSTPQLIIDSRLILTVVIGVLIGGLGFVGGMKYQSSRTATTAAAKAGGFQGFNGGASQAPAGAGQAGRRNFGLFGTVTAISSSSITVEEARQNTSQTLAITSSTTIMDGTASASISDIATGDRVLVVPDTATTTNAAKITINPAIPSRGGAAGTQPNTDPTMIN